MSKLPQAETPSLARSRYRKLTDRPQPLILPSIVRQISFLHPGYGNERVVLLRLPALDRDCTGLHHSTALYACAIVANNRWDGFFSTDLAGREPISTRPDELLCESEYYFHVPHNQPISNEPHKYPVVPVFAEWNFPHDRLPAGWAEALQPQYDPSSLCAVTNSPALTQTAHIVPLSEEDWFKRNQMDQYTNIDDTVNTLRVRVDVHQFFDRKPRFVIVPKNGRALIHVFNAFGDDAREAIELFHNVPVNMRGQLSAFLLARLAWTIFPFLEAFLTSKRPRYLQRKLEIGLVAQEESIDSCYDIWRRTYNRNRSLSPKKRSRALDKANDADSLDWTECSDDVYEAPRGRKRRRRGSSRLTTVGGCISLTDGSSVISANETGPESPESTPRTLDDEAHDISKRPKPHGSLRDAEAVSALDPDIP